MSEYEIILCSECEKPAQTRTGRGWYCNEHDPLVVLPRALADAERRAESLAIQLQEYDDQEERMRRLQTRLAAAEKLVESARFIVRTGTYDYGKYGSQKFPLIEEELAAYDALNSAASDTP